MRAVSFAGILPSFQGCSGCIGLMPPLSLSAPSSPTPGSRCTFTQHKPLRKVMGKHGRAFAQETNGPRSPHRFSYRRNPDNCVCSTCKALFQNTSPQPASRNCCARPCRLSSDCQSFHSRYLMVSQQLIPYESLRPTITSSGGATISPLPPRFQALPGTGTGWGGQL